MAAVSFIRAAAGIGRRAASSSLRSGTAGFSRLARARRARRLEVRVHSLNTEEKVSTIHNKNNTRCREGILKTLGSHTTHNTKHKKDTYSCDLEVELERRNLS